VFLLRQIKLKLLSLPLALFLISSCDLENPGGVLTNNQLPASVIEFFDNTDILENEEIIAYYDVTIVLDNSESAILTNKNLIYYKYGRVTRFPLSSIVSVEAEECFGLCIVATTRDDRVMEIEIAPLNGGDLFLELLTKQVDKA
tara:strand:- start:1105 stop:1536 length:432 start_codon:yes stop_codon:yes gene_type:complete